MRIMITSDWTDYRSAWILIFLDRLMILSLIDKTLFSKICLVTRGGAIKLTLAKVPTEAIFVLVPFDLER
jgi:hypothetical protein